MALVPETADLDTSLDFIWTTVDRIRTGMLTTFSGEIIRGRPMTAIPRWEQNTIWFFADRAAHAEADIHRDPRACVAFADPRDQTYVSLTGKVSLHKDEDLKKDLWNIAVDVYFPNGPEDPDVVLIGFEPEEGEYWDSPSNPILLAVKFVQAKLTNERPDLGENARVHLS